MAGGSQHDQLLVVVENMEDRMWSFPLYGIDIGDLFSDDAGDGEPVEMLPLPPSPMSVFKPMICGEYMVFTVSGSTVVGLTTKGRTLTYDTATGALGAGPAPAANRYWPAVIPIGDDVHALSLFPHSGPLPRFEALGRGSSAGEWSWRPLPGPPPDLDEPGCFVSCHFAVGSRLCLSTMTRGTYSLDTARASSSWRKEGEWGVELAGRALYVPELGGLLFGFCPHWCCLCAYDLEARPPALRAMWKETQPSECADKGYAIHREGSLVYLGDGKFCIARVVGLSCHNNGARWRNGLCLVGVEVTRAGGELRSTKRKIRCNTMSSLNAAGCALQPAQ